MYPRVPVTTSEREVTMTINKKQEGVKRKRTDLDLDRATSSPVPTRWSLTFCPRQTEQSTRRPGQDAAAEEVEMEVRDGLASSFLAVENQAVALVEAQLPGQLGGH
jgi:hypothetical protein